MDASVLLVFLCAASAHLNIGVLPKKRTISIMVGWAGRGRFGAPFRKCGSTNLVQFTTRRLVPLCGDIKITYGGHHA